jgi:ATP-dependent exoDNAse (exonuclease V) alpha subunit
VDIAIHAPSRRGNEHNYHAHLLLTTRRLEARGFTEKTRELDDLKSGEVTRWRERWAQLVNEHLAEHGHDARIDHRSLEAQGLGRDPTFHKGPAVTAIERRGESSRVAERVRDEVTERLQRAAERGRLERESQDLARSIIDTTTKLEAVLAEREAERTRSPEEIRRDAQAAWLAARAGPAEALPQPPQAERTLDLSGDLASARREARAQWLAQRDVKTATPAADASEGQGREPQPSKLMLPDDDRAL